MSDVIEQFINIHGGHWPAKIFHSHCCLITGIFSNWAYGHLTFPLSPSTITAHLYACSHLIPQQRGSTQRKGTRLCLL